MKGLYRSYGCDLRVLSRVGKVRILAAVWKTNPLLPGKTTLCWIIGREVRVRRIVAQHDNAPSISLRFAPTFSCLRPKLVKLEDKSGRRAGQGPNKWRLAWAAMLWHIRRGMAP